MDQEKESSSYAPEVSKAWNERREQINAPNGLILHAPHQYQFTRQIISKYRLFQNYPNQTGIPYIAPLNEDEETETVPSKGV